MVNRGIKQYSQREKALYRKYGIKSKGKRSRGGVSGRGAYKIGRPYVRGRGGYFTNLFKRIPKNFFNARKVGSTLGSAAGAALGSMIAPGVGTSAGAGMGSTLGGELGGLFKSITGWGDYTVRSNSLMFPDRIVPSFGEDSIRVKKREYITDINATTAFTNNSFPVNPGLSEVFPWLCSIANNYEQYRWNGLIFQFVSTSSDAIASTTDLGMGQVILASDYNAADAAYVNAQQMLGSMFSNSAKVSENILHAVECAPTDVPNKLYYVRSGDVPSGADIRLYDMLNFQLATQKMPANYTGAGQLWVTYDITLCKSVQNNQLGYDINTDWFQLTNCCGMTGGNYFGASSSDQTLKEHSNLGCTITDGHIIHFPVDLLSGYYMIQYSTKGDNSSANTDPAITATNCTVIQAWKGDTLSEASSTGSTGTRYVFDIVVRIDDRDASVGFDPGALQPKGTTVVGDLVISQVNGEIFAS